MLNNLPNCNHSWGLKKHLCVAKSYQLSARARSMKWENPTLLCNTACVFLIFWISNFKPESKLLSVQQWKYVPPTHIEHWLLVVIQLLIYAHGGAGGGTNSPMAGPESWFQQIATCSGMTRISRNNFFAWYITDSEIFYFILIAKFYLCCLDRQTNLLCTWRVLWPSCTDQAWPGGWSALATARTKISTVY